MGRTGSEGARPLRPRPASLADAARDDHVSTWRTSDPAEAEAAVAATYDIDNRLLLPKTDLGRFRMEFDTIHFGSSTAGVLTYSPGARVLTGTTDGYHVNITLRGRATGSSDGAELETADPGEGIAYPPGSRADATWFRDARVLALLLSTEVVEHELELLIGRRLREPVSPEPKIHAEGLGQALAPVIHLVLAQLARPTPLIGLAPVQRHVEGLLVNSFLLAHRHHYSDALARPARAAAPAPLRRAIELLEERPEDPWTTSTLAIEVHLSVRALQDGFKRHCDSPPMAYLRRVRLRRARQALTAARPGETTVQEIAFRYGILHLGRFSVAYRKEFGESPSVTLTRQPL